MSEHYSGDSRVWLVIMKKQPGRIYEKMSSLSPLSPWGRGELLGRNKSCFGNSAVQVATTVFFIRRCGA